MRFILCCVLGLCLMTMFVPSGRAVPPMGTSLNQAPFPEEEIVRRREAINNPDKSHDRGSGKKSTAYPGRSGSSSRALPLEGTLQIKSGHSSTLYGKVRQELTYTITERFVGNLIVTRSTNRTGQDATEHETYAIQTISTEIDASDFKGRVCGRYGGTPPACVQWQPLEIWLVGDGEEYPGRFEGVVSASTYGRSVTLRIDGPNILFLPAQGNQGLKSGCGDQMQVRVSREEFRQWMRQGHVRITRTLTKSPMGCRPDSTVHLEMRIGKK
jgi:hypothetical protein